jgi:hypothetical protein
VFTTPDDLLEYSSVKYGSFTKDLITRDAVYSPTSGDLTSKATWSTHQWFPCNQVNIPGVVRAFLFSKRGVYAGDVSVSYIVRVNFEFQDY